MGDFDLFCGMEYHTRMMDMPLICLICAFMRMMCRASSANALSDAVRRSGATCGRCRSCCFVAGKVPPPCSPPLILSVVRMCLVMVIFFGLGALLCDACSSLTQMLTDNG